MAFRPRPIQQPRIPIWVVGAWPSERSMNRAARWDGLLPNVIGGSVTPDAVRKMCGWVSEKRGSADGFEIVVEGTTRGPDEGSEPRAYAEAGATWWIESNWESFDTADARRRIEAGPPR